MKPSVVSGCAGFPGHYSLPSGLHAFGFTCLLGACWGGSRAALLCSGTFWFLCNALWEWACDASFPWPDSRYHLVEWVLLRPGLTHTCTADWTDVTYAAIGAMLPAAVAFAISQRRETGLNTEKEIM